MNTTRKSRFKKRAFVTGVVLLVLTIVSVLMLSLGSIGVMNLDTQQSYRNTSLAQYAAKAGTGEALSFMALNNAYGTGASPTTLSILLRNNIIATVNLATPPCNPAPCPQFYSVNNINGSGAVTDGLGANVPVGYVKINGFAAAGGKQVIYVVVAAPLPYSLFAKNSISAGVVTGSVRNDLTAGSPSITVTNPANNPLPAAFTPDTANGAIVGHVAVPVSGAAQAPIPTIDVASVAAGCGPPNGPSCAAQGCTDVTGAQGLNLDGSVAPGCWYSTGSLALNNGHGGLSMVNGARLYVVGDLTYNGAPTIGAVAPNNLIVCSGTFTTHGNLSGNNWGVSLILGGVAGQDAYSNNGAAGPNITGFLYTQFGNINEHGGSVTGNIIAKNGSINVGNVTYDQSYMNAYKSLLTTGVPLVVLSAWSQ